MVSIVLGLIGYISLVAFIVLFINKQASVAFKDQPDGECMKCKWNLQTNKSGNVDCNIPFVHLKNEICIAKLTTTCIRNIDWEMERNNDGAN